MSATYTAIWKQFCRAVEDPSMRKFFRFDPGLVTRSSIFELSRENEQDISKDSPANEDNTEKVPISPFPFPTLALLLDSGVQIMSEPEVEDDLFYVNMIVFIADPDCSTLIESKVEFVSTDEQVGAGRLQIAELRVACLDRMLRLQWTLPDSDESYQQILNRVKKTTDRARYVGRPDIVEAIQKITEDVHKSQADYVAVEQKRLADLGVIMWKTFTAGMKTVAWLCKPGNYIVREAPLVAGRQSSNGRIPRLGELSTHIVLHRDRIVREWHSSHGGGTKMPHLRRGHFRMLRSEFYRNQKGRLVWVRPCKVGDEVKWESAGRHYVVVG